jgi:hypothetical protein
MTLDGLARAMRSALRQHRRGPMSDDEARSTDKPSSQAPDAGMAYDPSMTDADEANLPPDSKADPQASPEAGHEERSAT